MGGADLPGFCVLAQTFSLSAPGKAFKSLLTTSITTLYAGRKFGTIGALEGEHLTCALRSTKVKATRHSS
jgi:hypothetical protein